MLRELKKQFYAAVYPSHPNEWEVEEMLERLVSLPEWQRNALLSRVSVVWPVSHSLCFSFLEYGAHHIARLGEADLDEWIRQFLNSYERKGLVASRKYMSDVEVQFYGRMAGAGSVHLADIQSKLQTFIRGVSSHRLDISSSSLPWTDLATIFLPSSIHHFSSESENSLFYTFLACSQWGYIALGTFVANRLPETPAAEEGQPVPHDSAFENVFGLFSDRQVAEHMYHFLEFARVYRMLWCELPGLMRKVKPLLYRFVQAIGEKNATAEVGREFFFHRMQELTGTEYETQNVVFDLQKEHDNELLQADEQLDEMQRLYAEFLRSGSRDDWSDFRDLVGQLQFDKVRERERLRREEEKQAFIEKMSALIRESTATGDQDTPDAETGGGESKEDGKAVVILTENEPGRERTHTLQVNNNEVEIPPEIAELIKEINKDLGQVPDGYVQAAAGVAGRAVQSGNGGGVGGAELYGEGDTIFYDEWDYRRQGYRKNWCSIVRKELNPVRSQFITDTCERYKGLMVRLRRQFEMLRTSHRFAKRNRHGDEIDFDALVDAVCDRAAGILPTDRLFIRQLRDQRDIAVMFLVDMSNSTEGWVGKAIKESLVILCDVLEIVGDRYAIYGFSGMRRSKCEVYRVKSFSESYGEIVQQRVCAISPREYTRMGPPIRYLTDELLDVVARVRLLIIISDGKPEDYDDYRGKYAIEDTRQALIEARGKGAIPFCITVDRQAHAYLAHMFGKDHYIYVDSVEKLPARIPEVYRHITR